MFTYNTKDRMRKANCYYSVELEGMENVHIRGAMFGYYKSGSDKERDENDRWPDDGLMLMKPGKLLKKMAEATETDVTDLDIENAVNKTFADAQVAAAATSAASAATSASSAATSASSALTSANSASSSASAAAITHHNV